MQGVMSEIARYSPDLVLLQETGGQSGADAFGDLLRGGYPTVFAWKDFVMATRYPALPNSAVQGNSYYRQSLETPLGRVAVYNVHTVSPRHPLFALRERGGLKRELSSGDASPLEVNAALRATQVRALAEAAASETDPVILAGDTNLPGLSPVLNRFLSSYEDGFSVAGWGFGYTFPTNELRPWMRIDRILAKGGPLRFVHFEVGHAFSASDHLCVVADVQRR
jgi:endonuclease/exonuclease/phosphatase (EEP) superfamily protein YafD